MAKSKLKKVKKKSKENLETQEVIEEQVQEIDQSMDLSNEEKLQKEIIELKDKQIRLFAEFENYKKRTAKERIDLFRNAGLEFFEVMLPVLDDFDRAKQNNENIEDPKIIKEGADLIQSKLFNTLQSKGLKAMDSKETPFDVDLHDAITNIPAPSKQLKGKVVDVIEKGYYLNDHVLRFAKVVVGQ